MITFLCLPSQTSLGSWLDEKRADGKNPPSILSPKGRKSSSAFLNSGHGVGNGLFTVNIKKLKKIEFLRITCSMETKPQPGRGQADLENEFKSRPDFFWDVLLS